MRTLTIAGFFLLALIVGCGDDPAPRDPEARVTVPESDDSPPSAEIALVLADGETAARAAQPGEDAPEEAVALEQPRIRGVAVGQDAESGLARVRVSTMQTATCEFASGRVVKRPLIRYYPPPQVERIQSYPGARLPAGKRRSVRLVVGGGRCPAESRLVGVHGELWGESINGLGLEAVTPHIRFDWKR